MKNNENPLPMASGNLLHGSNKKADRNKYSIKNSLYQSHEIVEKIVVPGDTVIDATAGNGGDTAFLSGLVGPEGKVYSFDIQPSAVQRTLEKLNRIGFPERVELICDGHQNIDLYVRSKVKTVMFNLGYLPGGDHSVGTKAETTIEALKKSMELLMLNGVITMVVYYGGDSGFEEKEKVLDYIKSIDCRKYTVMQSEFVNQVNCPPILVCIEKISE